jgi:signal transduction histidine kinase
VAVIDPEAVPANPKAPLVVIEAVLLDREPQRLQGPVRVPPGKANIEIQYTGLSLVNSDRLLFKYRLAGADDDWVEAGTRRVAYYAHLAPGRYTFTVLAANSDGVWNTQGASVGFIVEPKIWQRPVFQLSAAGLVLGLVVLSYRRRILRAERQQAVQQEFSRRLIQQAEIERRRIAAELHDSLGQNLVVVKNLAVLDQLAPPGGEKPASRSAEIAAAADRALEEVHAISYALRPPELDRLGLAKALAGMVRRAGEASGIRFETRLELNGALPAEADIHLFRIAQEAVNNLVKHSGAKTARVELWRDEGGVHLVVADEGRGLTPKGEGNGQQGLGLSSIEERARLIGAQCKWVSQPGKGTTLSVLLPL